MLALFTRTILLILILIFLIQVNSTSSLSFISKYAYHYYDIVYRGYYLRSVTCAFLHLDLAHLIMNCLSLLALANPIEKRMGTWKLLTSTAVLLVFNALVQTGITYLIISFPLLTNLYRGIIEFTNSGGSNSSGSSQGIYSSVIAVNNLVYGKRIGFSGILFSYLVIHSQMFPVSRSLMGLFLISADYYPWIKVFLAQRYGVDFVGHLSGVVSGVIFMKWVMDSGMFCWLTECTESMVPRFISTCNCYIASSYHHQLNRRGRSLFSSSSGGLLGGTPAFSGRGRSLLENVEERSNSRAERSLNNRSSFDVIIFESKESKGTMITVDHEIRSVQDLIRKANQQLRSSSQGRKIRDKSTEVEYTTIDQIRRLTNRMTANQYPKLLLTSD